ncbi:MAG TPA: hypothetical protein VF630_14660 [Hymenobacter sp.]|jgi:hypothetical protein
MSNYWFLLIPPLAIAAFVGFWCLIVKGLAVAGWQRLAAHYQVASLPPGPRFRLGHASVGGIRYRGAITAGATAEGLAMAVGFPFGIGHAPLLVPWAAVGPVEAKQALWMTSYETSIQTPASSVAFSFSSQELLQAAKPWLHVA